MTAILRWATVRNGIPVARREVPTLEGDVFRASMLEAVEEDLTSLLPEGYRVIIREGLE